MQDSGERQQYNNFNAVAQIKLLRGVPMKVEIKKGSLRIRPDGLFEIRYYQDNKRYSVYAKTEKEVMDKYNKHISKPKAKQIQKRQVNLKDFWTSWYELYKKPKLAINTLKIINGLFINYIEPGELAKKELTKITTTDIQAFLNKIKLDRTRELCLQYLKQCFKKAHETQAIKNNPTLAIEIKRAETDHFKALTTKQQVEFIKHIEKHPLKNFFYFCLLTGARRSAAFAFKWKNIDYEKGFVTIYEPKTKKARLVPLSEQLKSVLNSINKTNSEFVFNFRPDYPTKEFKRIKDTLGWHENIVLHSLRSTLVTRMNESNIRPDVSMEIAGHQSFDVHYKIYNQVQNERIKEEYSKVVDKLILPPNTTPKE